MSCVCVCVWIKYKMQSHSDVMHRLWYLRAPHSLYTYVDRKKQVIKNVDLLDCTLLYIYVLCICMAERMISWTCILKLSYLHFRYV